MGIRSRACTTFHRFAPSQSPAIHLRFSPPLSPCQGTLRQSSASVRRHTYPQIYIYSLEASVNDYEKLLRMSLNSKSDLYEKYQTEQKDKLEAQKERDIALVCLVIPTCGSHICRSPHICECSRIAGQVGGVVGVARGGAETPTGDPRQAAQRRPCQSEVQVPESPQPFLLRPLQPLLILPSLPARACFCYTCIHSVVL